MLDLHPCLDRQDYGEKQQRHRGAQRGAHVQCPPGLAACADSGRPGCCGSSTATVRPSSIRYFAATLLICSAATALIRSGIRSASRKDNPLDSSSPSSSACAKNESLR